MAAPNENVDVGRDEWRTGEGTEYEGTIRQMDGERGIPKIVGNFECGNGRDANMLPVSSSSSLRSI